jgi:hypothetical protein
MCQISEQSKILLARSENQKLSVKICRILQAWWHRLCQRKTSVRTENPMKSQWKYWVEKWLYWEFIVIQELLINLSILIFLILRTNHQPTRLLNTARIHQPETGTFCRRDFFKAPNQHQPRSAATSLRAAPLRRSRNCPSGPPGMDESNGKMDGDRSELWFIGDMSDMIYHDISIVCVGL